MAIEYKYGRVTTEHGTIGDDEPVVIFRAQDKTLPDLLLDYEALCRLAGSPQTHLDRIRETRRKIIQWQGHGRNPLKTPD